MVNWDELTDRELVALAKTGDKRAWSQLAKNNKDIVWGLCLSKCKDPDLAADASQNAFSLALRNLDRFEGKAKFSTWICAIARNACFEVLRRRQGRRAREISLDIEDNGTKDRLSSSKRPIDTRVANIALVAELLEKLQPVEREALVKYAVGGYKIAEIAEDIGKSTTATKTMLSRTKQKLRKQIPRELFF